MSNFALKVSIDGTRYLIRGVERETSRKDVLCAVAKYRSKEQLPNLSATLSRSLGNLSIVECRRSSERSITSSGISSGESDGISKRSDSKSKHGRRHKRSFEESKGEKFPSKLTPTSGKSSLNQTAPTFEKQPKKLHRRNSERCKSSKLDQKTESGRLKQRSFSRSNSFSEKNARISQKLIEERPKSYAEFDRIDLNLKGETVTKISSNENCSGQYSGKRKWTEQKAFDDSDLEMSKTSNRRIRNLIARKHYDDSDIASLCEIQSEAKGTFRRAKTSVKRNKLSTWLQGLKRTSTTYFLDNSEINELKPIVVTVDADLNNNGAKIGKVSDDNKQTDSELTCTDSINETSRKQSEELADYAEAETDSGLPSLDYESSLDTISRDDRISFDQSCEEEKFEQQQVQNDSGLKCRNCSQSDCEADCHVWKTNSKDDIVCQATICDFTNSEICEFEKSKQARCVGDRGESETGGTTKAADSNGTEIIRSSDKVSNANLHSFGNTGIICSCDEPAKAKLPDSNETDVICRSCDKEGKVRVPSSKFIEVSCGCRKVPNVKVHSCNKLEETVENLKIAADCVSVACETGNSFTESPDTCSDVSQACQVRLSSDSFRNKDTSDCAEELHEAINSICLQTTRLNEELLHKELSIAQLEHQIEFISEEIEHFDELEMEVNEKKLISELKDLEEFLTAITKLSQYQRAKQNEILSEIEILDSQIKERYKILHFLNRQLLRDKYKTIPRHLSVLEQKQRHVNKLSTYKDKEIINEGDSERIIDGVDGIDDCLDVNSSVSLV